jgi:hypothetical protein
MVKSPLGHSICSLGVKFNCLKLFSLSQTLQQQETRCTRACSLRFILTGRHQTIPAIKVHITCQKRNSSSNTS